MSELGGASAEAFCMQGLAEIETETEAHEAEVC